MKRSIAIIGAGPAGSVAAILLARGGFPVTLVEQHRFPRDKVCGECVSAIGIDVLHRIGALDRIRELGAISLQRAEVHSPDGSSLRLNLPRKMLGISRAAFDSALFVLARNSGAAIRQPARCEQISPGKFSVRDLISNRIDALAVDHIIVADGKSLGRQRTGDIGIKSHFTNVSSPRDAIELFGVRGSYGGIAPIEDGLFNISFSIPAARINQSRGDLDAMFANVITENRVLRETMRGAKRVSDWLSAPLHRFGVRPFDSQIIPIGNAAVSIEPIGGEGMGMAMRSAELAVNAIIRGVDPTSLRREYQALWRARRFACRTAAMVISRPGLANFLVDGIDGSDLVLHTLLRLVGKSLAVA